MLNVVFLLLPVFFLIGLGILAERMALLPPQGATVLNRFVFHLCLPALIFISIASCDPGELRRLDFFAASSISMYGCFLIAFLAARRVLGKSGRESAMYAMNASFCNAVFVGLPLLIALFPQGNAAILAATGVNILQIPMVMLLMTLLEQRQTGLAPSRRRRIAGIVRSLAMNPVLISACLGFMFCGLAIPVPQAVERVCRMLGGTVPPCALISIGLVFSAQMRNLRACLPDLRSQLWINGIKVLLYPAVVWLLMWGMGVEPQWLAMGVLLAAMPTGSVAFILSDAYQVAAVDTSWAIISNTAASIVVIPVFVFLLAMNGFYTL